MKMNGSHWTVIGIMLGAVALQLASVKTWSDATSPAFVCAVLVGIANTLKALNTTAPKDSF